ncbi:PGAP2-interacting protein-like [Mytilus galloprovincialis]|uniref:PGAP2-interacting protein-like n=1 Tax=Mytilus galloprovincialis TaxID=29158 RepID=UPI003F7BA605
MIETRTLVRECVQGYVFWSLFQGLGPMIWFYPLNELELSGYEIFAVTFFAPVLVGIPGVLKLLQNRWMLGILRLATVGSLASFQASTTLIRLAILALGTGAAMLIFTVTLWSKDSRIRCHTFWGIILGFLSFVSCRVWFVSFVPTWWSNQTNSIVIGIGAIAVLDHIISGSDISEVKESPSKTTDRPYWLPTAIGFGSLLYLTHWCFGESSLVLRWVVKGYPDHGPAPYPWGAFILIGLGLGVLIMSWSRLTRSKIWWIVGLISILMLYYLPTWMGFIGGLGLSIFTMSIWSVLVDRLTLCPPARSMFVVMVTYLVQIFFFVWTVAYNFVPGGVYTREHTDYLIAAVMIGIFIGMFIGGEYNSHTAFPCDNKKPVPFNKIRTVTVLIMCIGLLGYGMRYSDNQIKQPEKKNEREFSAAIWTFHFGYDNKGWPSMERAANLFKDTGADVITLLESDASKPFLGNNDLGMWFGEKLGMYVDFGPATKDHTWGNLLLSKYPIVKSTHHLLPSPHGELAPAITATVNISGNLVDFVVTHMGNHRDRLDRKLQAKFLAKELTVCENPVIFLGYVTSAPHSPEYNDLIKAGNVKDIDETDYDRWCEYIMYRGLKRLGYARITHAGLSDTEIQMAKFEIPEDPKNYKDNTRVITDSSRVNKEVHFNHKFGKFKSGHRNLKTHGFHMDTPKYFLP